MCELRRAYVDIETKLIDKQIKKEMQRRDSWEIDDLEYDDRFNSLMQRYEMLVANLLPQLP